jgi:hypothetical protein
MPIGHPCEEYMDPFPMDNRLSIIILKSRHNAFDPTSNVIKHLLASFDYFSKP